MFIKIKKSRKSYKKSYRESRFIQRISKKIENT